MKLYVLICLSSLPILCLTNKNSYLSHQICSMINLSFEPILKISDWLKFETFAFLEIMFWAFWIWWNSTAYYAFFLCYLYVSQQKYLLIFSLNFLYRVFFKPIFEIFWFLCKVWNLMFCWGFPFGTLLHLMNSCVLYGCHMLHNDMKGIRDYSWLKLFCLR